MALATTVRQGTRMQMRIRGTAPATTSTRRCAAPSSAIPLVAIFLLRHRQLQRERRARPVGAVDNDAATDEAREILGYGETEPDAGLAPRPVSGAVEGVEHSRLLLDGDSDARVAHGERSFSGSLRTHSAPAPISTSTRTSLAPINGAASSCTR